MAPLRPRELLLLAALLASACTPAPASSAVADGTNDAGATGGARYLALGDSFTIGTGSSSEESFPARLVARLGCGIVLENVAMNGYSSGDLIDSELPLLSRFAPTFVTVRRLASEEA